MTSFLDTFGNSPVSPSEVAFAAYTFSVDAALFWPQFSAGQTNVAARFMNITATVPSINISMPDASLVSTGYDVIIFNAGSDTFNIVDFNGGAIATIATGQTYYIIIKDNTTQAGLWQTVQFGVGTGSASAMALAGSGLIAIAGLLNVNFNATTASGSYSIGTGARATLQVWTGGAGIITLPNASSVGNGFFFPIANNGSGSVVVTTSGGDLIDGASTSTFSQTQSGFIISSGSGWFTVGKGQQLNFLTTLLNLNVAGNSDVTETSAEAENIIQQYTGILTGNINVIVPSTVQIYYIFNNTTGAFTLTVKTASGTGIAVAQGSHVILYCDGTNVVNAFTSTFSGSVSIAAGSASNPNLNIIGSPTTGIFSPATDQIAFTAGGTEVMNFLSAASAVNYLQVQATATGNPVILSALGSDTNVGINYTAKGTGSHNFLANGGATQFFVGNVSNAVNQLSVQGAATASAPRISVSGSDTNINISYVSKGSGTHNFTGQIIGNLTGNISGTAPAGTLTGTTLASNVVTSSLTSVGILSSGTWSATPITGTFIASSVALSGNPTTTTQTSSDNSTKIATTAFVQTVFSGVAPLNSPAFTGIPTAPTAAIGTSTTQLATTAFTNPATTNGATGSVTLPGGTILKWGNVGLSSHQTATVTFGTTFPNSCDWAGVSSFISGGASGTFELQVTAKGASSIDVFNSDGGASQTCYWLAIGH